jgi:glycosyltransferase involved in cell wall biosynthesis
MSDHGLKMRFDPGFNRCVAWDLDLLGGYRSEFLETYIGKRFDAFWSLRLKSGFASKLCELDADVLWIQGWQVAAYWQAVLEARRIGVGVWLRGESNSRSSASGRLGRRFKNVVLDKLLSSVDRILYIGEANRQFYLERGVKEEQLAPAPYCVDNARFASAAVVARKERHRIRKEWGIPIDAFCFVFVGKFTDQKRPLDLVEAARCLQDKSPRTKIHLLWVGTGELAGEIRQGCSVSVDLMGGAAGARGDDNLPNASFVGFLNQSEISRAYVAADCLVLPSDARETWGLVVNEAMASGLPCIVSRECGCAEDLIEPLRPELCFPSGDIIALERAMAAVIADRPRPEILNAHAAKYDINQTIDTVESLYSKVSKRGISSQSDFVRRK